MKYLSIDIETTGLDREKHQILEFAAIYEDTHQQLDFDSIAKYRRIILNHGDVIGSPYAITMPHNHEILKILANIPPESSGGKCVEYYVSNKIIEIDFLARDFANWYSLVTKQLETPFKVNVAGKNFRDFDYEFLKRVPELFKYFKFNRRYIDLGSRIVDFSDDEEIPNQNECLSRLNIHEKVRHDALNDAWQVILALRKTY
jgi:hypothetical protein